MLKHALLACGVETSVIRHSPIQVAGQIIEPLANDMFLVLLDDGRQVRAHIPGVMRTKIVRILPGDRVRVEILERDISRGRIVERLRT